MSRPDTLSVVVCRGCCCGTDKHPQVDHAAQLEELRAVALSHGRARLWEVDCLGPCSSSNVVVVRSGTARRWFGQMLDPHDTARLAEWIRSGAAILPPPRLAARQFDPDPTIGALVEPLDVSGEDLADLVFATLTATAGSWSMGVHGAMAESSLTLTPPSAGQDPPSRLSGPPVPSASPSTTESGPSPPATAANRPRWSR